MRICYILSHHDDELGAWPLIRKFQASGASQKFIFMTACGEDDLAVRRQQETIRGLATCGLSAPECVFLGYDHRIPTYELHEHLPRARDLLMEVVSSAPGPTTIVTHAWEGGHVDHDVCFALACWLLTQLRPVPEALQFSLYHMRATRWPLFRAANPIPENGPLLTEQLSMRNWLRYALAARRYPSQWRVLLPLWPSMLASFAIMRGYRFQNLASRRLWERPHAGPLMYEQVNRALYDDVRRRVEEMFFENR